MFPFSFPLPKESQRVKAITDNTAGIVIFLELTFCISDVFINEGVVGDFSFQDAGIIWRILIQGFGEGMINEVFGELLPGI